MRAATKYLLLNLEGQPITDRLGAATFYDDWDEAAAVAEKDGGQSILILRPARRTSDVPRRGRRPKQQQEES